jgi:hypothetical protein
MKNPFGEGPIEAANDNDRTWPKAVFWGVVFAVGWGAYLGLLLSARQRLIQ